MSEAINPSHMGPQAFPNEQTINPQEFRSSLESFSGDLKSMLDDPSVCDRPDFKERLAGCILSLESRVKQGLQSDDENLREASQIVHGILIQKVSNSSKETSFLSAAQEYQENPAGSSQMDSLFTGLIDYQPAAQALVQEIDLLTRDL